MMYDFMKFNALKIVSKIHLEIINKGPGLIFIQGNLLAA